MWQRMQIRYALHRIVKGLVNRFGSTLSDSRTGKPLGKGLVVGMGRQARIIGAPENLIPIPLPQTRTTFWNQRIGFTVHEEPRFSLRPPAMNWLAADGAREPKLLLVLLDHRSAHEVNEAQARWASSGFPPEDVVLAYGGPRSEFSRLEVPQPIYLSDPRLRTRDHQRERQSYREILHLVSEWLRPTRYTHLLFCEYDVVPLVPDLGQRLLRSMKEQEADLLGCRVERVDGSTNAKWLNCCLEDPEPGIVLSMLGAVHFWSRTAWERVAADDRLAEWYLELDLPTTAHRLGFRVRDLAKHKTYVVPRPEDLRFRPADAKDQGAWMIHPVKQPVGIRATH